MKTNFIQQIIRPRSSAITLLTILALAVTFPAMADTELAGLKLNGSNQDMRVGGEPVRLHGISFPVEDNLCGTGPEECQALAMEFLNNWIERPELVQCNVLATLSSGTHLSRCYYRGEELASRLVKRGRAVADRRASRRYVRDEHEARRNERGFWGPDFRMVALTSDPF